MNAAEVARRKEEIEYSRQRGERKQICLGEEDRQEGQWREMKLKKPGKDPKPLRMPYPRAGPLYPNHYRLTSGEKYGQIFVWIIDEKARQVGEINQEDVGEIHAWNYEGLNEEIVSERMSLRSFKEKELTGPNADHGFQLQTLK